ncbi:conjugal transfer protein TrbB [Mycolicibacterium sp. CBMA 226]|uniref:conjugal transfer protein TrbB n=1 Tax=Mycolicibacterium sp. CBMA 226 TaxID=2606611 RepID=UPI001AA11C95|nr:conjugal transfer protein TrbB [Mycolicibacterium sp. CBMA 226]
MVLHTARARDGRRHLSEIAVLRRAPDATVTAVTAWQVDRGSGPGLPVLRELLVARGRS